MRATVISGDSTRRLSTFGEHEARTVFDPPREVLQHPVLRREKVRILCRVGDLEYAARLRRYVDAEVLVALAGKRPELSVDPVEVTEKAPNPLLGEIRR